jgi:hypothetical protein
VAFANQIKPLDANGNIDTTAGKVVWLSIGMSNTTQETQAFIPLTDTLTGKNPKLILIDGAQGGQDINIINNPSDPFWTTINTRLQQAGLTPAQVQAVWFKQAEKNPVDTAFATYPDALKAKFRTAMQIIKSKFPNAKLCYLTSRIYAGYATSSLNPEPYAWYSGWTVKRLIEDQVNGDTALAYAGPNARVPWLAWGPYPWADGTTPRSDGLMWKCPDDYISDGTHPSTLGRQKIASMLLQFFTTDETTRPWFMTQVPTGISEIRASDNTLQFYPQPATGSLTISFPENATVTAKVKVYDFAGRALLELSVSGSLTHNIDISDLAPGIYLVRAGKCFGHFLKR